VERVRRASLFPTRILLAADGSEDAQRAIKTALGLCTNLESEPHVVYVAPEHPYVHAYYDLRHREEEEWLRRGD
jgi:nucleotide-binding universal stress UspA family protein